MFDFVSTTKNILIFFYKLNIPLCSFLQVKCCYLLKQSLKIYFLVETKTEKMFACGNKSKSLSCLGKETTTDTFLLA